MDSRMITMALTSDMHTIREIMIQPSVWDRLTEDGMGKENYMPEMTKKRGWLMVKDDDSPIGAIIIDTETSTSISIHPYLIGDKRALGRDMMQKFYEWFLENIKDTVIKINVKVPKCHKIVYNFAKNVGFKYEGTTRQGFRKYGKIHDQWNLGITRDEIQEYLKCQV